MIDQEEVVEHFIVKIYINIMENNKTQSAVEWLEQEFLKLEQTVGVHGVMYELLEQAKIIEEQRIKQELEKLKDFEVWKEWKNSNDL